MNCDAKALRTCLAGALLASALLLDFSLAAQTVSTTKKRIPQSESPADVELRSLLARGQAAIDRKEFQTAAQAYQDYLAKKPDDAVAHFQLGYAYSGLQKNEEAQAEYERAITLSPTMAAAYLNLGLTLLDIEPARAAAPLTKAAELLPDEARPKFLLGWALERSGKIAEALAQYEAAEKLDDKNYDIHFAHGRALLILGRAADAEAQFRTALALRPDSPEARYGLADCLLAQKKTAEAEAALASYLEAKPDDRDARIEHASVLVDLEKDEAALAELDRVASAGPEDVGTLKLRSLIYFHQKKYDQAIPVLEKAEATAPADTDVRARLGHLFLEKKQYAEATRELAAAFRINPAMNDVLGDLIAAQYLNKNYAAALEGLDLLAKRENLPAGSWFIRASCYDKLGRQAEALEAYQKFLERNTDQTSNMYFEAAARARVLTREVEEKKK